MRSAFLALACVMLLGLGVVHPFILGLGYVWVDLFSPQYVAFSLIRALPFSMIFGVATLAAYLVMDRKCPPRVGLTLILLFILAAWVTFTCTIAVAPSHVVWKKWDWAFKAIVFGGFISFLFRSRVQIEAFLLVYIFALSGTFLSFGAKTLLGGGGYGYQLGLVTANTGLGEGSTLAVVSVSVVPLLVFLSKHSVVLPQFRGRHLLFFGLIFAALATSVGTFARAGFVALIAMFLLYWWMFPHKIRNLLVGTLIVAGLAAIASNEWYERISTTWNFQNEGSALTRIAVWEWTLDFVADRPFGGGFHAFVVNELTFVTEEGNIVTDKGRAFHSVIFEVLGEHGYPGLIIFALLILSVYMNLGRAKSLAGESPHAEWTRDLCGAVSVAITTFLVGGLFLGIAFQPMLYYYIATSVCILNFARRAGLAARSPGEEADRAGREARPSSRMVPSAGKHPAE
jgi:probable O-glycosylation ligase (exosortase A-associated)